MPRHSRTRAQRKREQIARRDREEEYRSLGEQLHRDWCERLDEVEALSAEELLAAFEQDEDA